MHWPRLFAFIISRREKIASSQQPRWRLAAQHTLFQTYIFGPKLLKPRIFRNLAEFCEILRNFAKFSEILRNFVKFCGILRILRNRALLCKNEKSRTKAGPCRRHSVSKLHFWSQKSNLKKINGKFKNFAEFCGI